METLKERGKQSKVYSQHQLLGLEIATLLEDDSHKSLYIGLVKKYPKVDLLGLAKDISTRKNVSNKGAYFMRVASKYFNGKEK